MMPDGFRDTGIGPVPVEWDVTPLGSLASVRYGKGKPKREGAVPVIGSGGIYAWVDEPLVAFPTLVIGRKGTAGRWRRTHPCACTTTPGGRARWWTGTTTGCTWRRPRASAAGWPRGMCRRRRCDGGASRRVICTLMVGEYTGSTLGA